MPRPDRLHPKNYRGRTPHFALVIVGALVTPWPFVSCNPTSRGGDGKGGQAERDGDSAQFGIFFGGQIQARKEIPFNLNPAKQRMGFRVLFATPPATDTTIHWELSKPGPKKGSVSLARPDQRITQLGKATIPRGSQRFDQDLAFTPGDDLGLWNIRVTIGHRVLIDRPFSVYDAAARRAARHATRKPDAGL